MGSGSGREPSVAGSSARLRGRLEPSTGCINDRTNQSILRDGGARVPADLAQRVQSSRRQQRYLPSCYLCGTMHRRRGEPTVVATDQSVQTAVRDQAQISVSAANEPLQVARDGCLAKPRRYHRCPPSLAYRLSSAAFDLCHLGGIAPAAPTAGTAAPTYQI